MSTQMALSDFFLSYDLQNVAEFFYDNGFTTFQALTMVSDDDLKEIGIKQLGVRKQILWSVADCLRKDPVVENNKSTSSNYNHSENNEHKEHSYCEDKTKDVSVMQKRKLSFADLKYQPVSLKNKGKAIQKKKSRRKLSFSPLQITGIADTPTTERKREMFSPSVKFASKSTQKLKLKQTSLTEVFKLDSDYPNARARGLHIYSKEEIIKAKGLDKQRFLFWNEKGEKICEDTTLRHLGCQEVHGILDFIWLEKKTELLLSEADSVKPTKPRQEARIQNNVQRVMNANRSVKSTASLLELEREQNFESEKGTLLELNLKGQMQHLRSALKALHECLVHVKLKEEDSKETKEEDYNVFQFSSDSDDEEFLEIVKKIKMKRD